MGRRVHEHLLHERGRVGVRRRVPADVLARDHVLHAAHVHVMEDQVPLRGDLVGEVVTHGHVLCAPARDALELRVPPERGETVGGARLVRQLEELGLVGSAERRRRPRGDARRRRDGEGPPDRREREDERERKTQGTGAETAARARRLQDGLQVLAGHGYTLDGRRAAPNRPDVPVRRQPRVPVDPYPTVPPPPVSQGASTAPRCWDRATPRRGSCDTARCRAPSRAARGGLSSIGRASDCGSDGCGFKSRRPPHFPARNVRLFDRLSPPDAGTSAS